MMSAIKIKYNKEEAKALLPLFQQFEGEVDSLAVSLYYLTNESGMTAAITNYGARIVGLVVPDKAGNPVDVVVGPGSLSGYTDATEYYLGAAIGRVGNRIGGAKFVLDDKAYTLFANNGPNTLHGGQKGFESRVWNAVQPEENSLELTYESPEGEEGFPGNLQVKVTYRLTEENALEISYEARTDKRTPVNLTNHAYFNLNGEGSGLVNDHLLQIAASNITPVDADLIPTGQLQRVQHTPFDFRELTTIGSRVEVEDEQLYFGGGYDHNFALDKGRNYGLAAVSVGDKSGVKMEVYTDMPGIQFYGGNFLNGGCPLKSGKELTRRTAFCLETQFFPDAVNQPDFDSIILNPDDTFHSVSSYRFSV